MKAELVRRTYACRSDTRDGSSRDKQVNVRHDAACAWLDTRMCGDLIGAHVTEPNSKRPIAQEDTILLRGS